MSWDTIEYDYFSPCACGNGKVVQHIQRRDGDWNRTEISVLGEEILCPNCREKYYIKHLVRHYSCMSWDGDGISDSAFLVPNDCVFPDVKSKRIFSFSKIDESIAAKFSLSDINQALDDMITHKYTTKLQLNVSYSIVGIYFKRYKKKSLNLIIPVLKEIIEKYDSYEWTPESIKKYQETEQQEINENEKKIEESIKKSFELNFSGCKNE